MYEPTLAAVNSRDFGYLGLFVLGAIVGLGLFVRLLQYALTHHRVVTLVVMTGLMAGSLRALWPWQGSSGQLWPVPPDSASVWWGMAGGAALVISLVLVERFWQRTVHFPAL
jgi:putative membrane protein